MPAAQTCTSSMKMSSASGAVSVQRGADRLRDPAPVRVPAVQRGLDQRRVGDRARDAAATTSSPPPRTTTRPIRLEPSPSRTMSSASLRSAQSSASPKRTSSSVCGSTTHAARARRLQDHGVVGRELAVHGDAVERARDAHAEQQVGASPPPAPRRSGRSRASSRTRARSSPRPWPARSAARCRTAARRRPRPPWRTCPSSGSPRRSRRGRTRAARARARAMPRMTSPASSSTPITPVEATATWSSRTPPAIAAAPCMRAASSKPRRPVAALALPELATITRIASSRARSWVSTTGAASTPERVKRAALTQSGRRAHHQTDIHPAGRLQPARDARGAEARRAGRRGCSVTCSGHLQPAELTADPPSRAGRTSGSGSARPATPRPSTGCRSPRRRSTRPVRGSWCHEIRQ